MVKRIRTINGLNKELGWRFCVGFGVQHETPEEGRGTHQPKLSEYNNEEEDSIHIILSDKNTFIDVDECYYFLGNYKTVSVFISAGDAFKVCGLF